MNSEACFLNIGNASTTAVCLHFLPSYTRRCKLKPDSWTLHVQPLQCTLISFLDSVANFAIRLCDACLEPQTWLQENCAPCYCNTGVKILVLRNWVVIETSNELFSVIPIGFNFSYWQTHLVNKMLCINPAQLIESMKWACEHVKNRCCGSVCLDFFYQGERTREKETQQAKDETSSVKESGQWKQRTFFQTAPNISAF